MHYVNTTILRDSLICAQGYHVWAKLIEACADLGYGPNNLVRTLWKPLR